MLVQPASLASALRVGAQASLSYKSSELVMVRFCNWMRECHPVDTNADANPNLDP